MHTTFILTYDTGFRDITFAVDYERLIAGVSICHYYNGETGADLETRDAAIGRQIARHRLETGDRLLNLDLAPVIQEAFRSGHTVTLREIVMGACLRAMGEGYRSETWHLKGANLPSKIREHFDAERVAAEERAAWAEYLDANPAEYTDYSTDTYTDYVKVSGTR